MTGLAWVGVALAHPSGGALWGLALALDVQEERLVVDYRVEIPGEVVIRELYDASAQGTAATFGARRLAALRDGLEIRLDGSPAAFTHVPLAQRSDDPRFVLYQLRLEAPLPPGAHDLDIIDTNGPLAATVHLSTARIAPGWSLAATSLVDVDPEGRITDHDGAWRAEPTARRTTLALRPAGPLARWLRPTASPPRGALALPFGAALTDAAPRSGPVALAAALAAVAGLAVATGRRADLAGLGIVLGVAAAASVPPTVAAGVGLVAGALGVARGAPWAIGLALGATAASFGDVRAAVPIAAVACLGLLLRRGGAVGWAERVGVAALMASVFGVLWRVA